MSTICAICKRKQSGWIQDYPLSNESLNMRICCKCHEQLDAIKDNTQEQRVDEAIEYFNAYLSTDISCEAKNTIETAIEEYRAAKEKVERDQEDALRLEREKQEELERSRIINEEQARKEREQQYHIRLSKLREAGQEGYYEYKVVSLLDEAGLFRSSSGKVNAIAMTNVLNELGLDGWHLVTAYSNELGKNALSGGVGGVMLGANSTVDENILIFERFVKI